jgi:hypothetical protein
MAPATAAAKNVIPSWRARRRLLRLFLHGCLAISAVAIAGCANRRELPEERRTRSARR